MAGKGFDYYRNSYTHQELWRMLFQGDDWSVRQAGSLWRTAKGGLEGSREEMTTNVVSLRSQWTGEAAEEFERRLAITEEYSREVEKDLERAAERTVPNLAEWLKEAQERARSEDLFTTSEETFEQWLYSKHELTKDDARYLASPNSYQQGYENYKNDRHDAMARIVAELGEKYARVEDDMREPPPPPPSDMPGNSTYSPPTGGVFGSSPLNSSGAGPGAPGMGGANGMTGGAGGIGDYSGTNGPEYTTYQGDDDVADPWNFSSYDDPDSDLRGGLAGVGPGGMPPGGGPVGSTVGSGFAGAGGGAVGASSGLFGPARGGGAGGGPGRGTGGTSNSPARSGGNTGRGGSGARGGTGTNSSGGRGGSSRGGMGRGATGRGAGAAAGRGGSGHSEEEEETTRETWLKEDEFDWRDHTPREEIDD